MIKKNAGMVFVLLVASLFFLSQKVNAQSIVIFPSAGTIGSIVTITGQGFSAAEGIIIDFGMTSTIAAATTDTSGTFSAAFAVDNQPVGTVTVSAVGKTSQTEAAIEFNILPFPPSLKFTKSVTPAVPVSPGETLTYTLTYINEGSGTATKVILTDEIPAGTSYITDSAVGAGTVISYSHDGGINYDGLGTEPVTHIKWELNTLAPGAGGNVSFVVRVE
ncbi:DUF11 domain-containing protein [bacterium]|nr:DUF11 domain-containing protein [bacterium]MBU1752313.1 DUF11 domain-containing protein [bacterium]